MMRLVRVELVKQLRRPRTWVALGFMVLVPVIMTIALKANPPTGGPNGDGQGLFFLSSKTGILMGAAGLNLMSRFFLVVVAVIFAGDAVSSEAAWGNLRSVLVRPVTRARLLRAKLGVVALFALIATVLVSITGFIGGIIVFGWHPLDINLSDFGGAAGGTANFGPSIVHGFSLHQTQLVIVGHLALATVLVTWNLAAYITFAFMLSTMTDLPSGAIFGGIGLYVVAQVLDAITAIGSIRNGFPTHYYDAWTNLFTGNHWTADMTRSVLIQVPYVVLFCAIAWWWFARKDITS